MQDHLATIYQPQKAQLKETVGQRNAGQCLTSQFARTYIPAIRPAAKLQRHFVASVARFPLKKVIRLPLFDTSKPQR